MSTFYHLYYKRYITVAVKKKEGPNPSTKKKSTRRRITGKNLRIIRRKEIKKRKKRIEGIDRNRLLIRSQIHVIRNIGILTVRLRIAISGNMV